MTRQNKSILTAALMISMCLIFVPSAYACGGGGGSAPRSSYGKNSQKSAKKRCKTKHSKPIPAPVQQESDPVETIDDSVLPEPPKSSPSDLSQKDQKTPAKTVSAKKSMPPRRKATKVAETPRKKAKNTKTGPNRVASEPVSEQFIVVQESKPGSGLDVNASVNPAINRGVFENRDNAEQTAEMWRDVMPGWEVEVKSTK